MRKWWLLALALPLAAAVPPAAWVPARWNFTDPQSLDLLSGTPVNCLLVKSADAAFADQAKQRGIAVLAVIAPDTHPEPATLRAIRSHLAGVVLEGDFTDGTQSGVRDALAGSQAIVIRLTSRSGMKLDSADPVVGTYQGVWPGIQVLEDGHAKAGPSGSAWIDTNTGFLRTVRAWGHDTIWLGNLPPAKTVIPAEGYLQAVADAALAGGRWILALDDDFAARLGRRDAAAVRDWKRIAAELEFFESHPQWRGMKPYGKLAIVQDTADGALLSGGILDMVGSRHTPVRAIPRQRLAPEALKDSQMAVDVDPQALTPAQKELLKQFTRSGGTLLSAPAGWNQLDQVKPDRITLPEEETKRLNDIFHDVQSMIGRRNLGAAVQRVVDAVEHAGQRRRQAGGGASGKLLELSRGSGDGAHAGRVPSRETADAGGRRAHARNL